ncbi:pectate lyase [Paenibacillus tarimensis]
MVLFLSAALTITPFAGLKTVGTVHAAEAVSIIEDRFDDLETGIVPPSYEVQADQGRVVVADVPAADDKSVLLEDNGTNVIKISKAFTAETGTVTASLSFMQPVLGSTSKVIRLLDESLSKSAVHIETRSGGKLAYKNADGTFTELADYADGQWVSVKVIADQSAKTAKVYIDNELKLEDAPFQSEVASIAGLDSFTPGTSAKSHYIDDVLVFSGAYEEDLPLKQPIAEEPGGEEPGEGDNGGDNGSEEPPVSGGVNGIYEAEDAVLSGVIIDNKHAGYTGTGFIDYAPNVPGGTVEWNVNVEAAGEYTLEFRYANGSTDNRATDILVNGEKAGTLQFETTSEWAAWKSVKLKAELSEGANTIVALATAASGGPNIDHLRIFNEVDLIFEAEDAALTAAIIDNKHAGFTGTGFVDYSPNTPGGIIEWSVDIPAAGMYTLEFKYAIGATDNRPLEIKVNGEIVEAELSFAPTGDWTSWQTVTASAALNAGGNTITATAVGPSGGPNVDHLRIHNLDQEDDGPTPVELELVALDELVEGLTLQKLIKTGVIATEESLSEERPLTRVEFFAGINQVLGYMPAQDTYKYLENEDTNDTWWTYVLEAALAAGYLPTEDGNLEPNRVVSRPEAAKILARVLDLKTGKDANGANGAVIKEGLMEGKGGFGPNNPLMRSEAEQIFEKVAARVQSSEGVQIVRAESVAPQLIAVHLNGSFDSFDIHSLQLQKAAGVWKGLNPMLREMYPTRAAVAKNRFGQTVVLYEIQETMTDGKLPGNEGSRFTGDLQEAVKQAEYYVSWQMDHGGWNKNMASQFARMWNGQEPRTDQFGPNGEELGTIDNNATVDQIRFISQVYKETGEERFRSSVLKGLDFLQVMQYPTGGWPQVYPKRGNYSDYVTFNDNAMINVMDLLDDIVDERYPFDGGWIGEERAAELQEAIDKGIEYILKSQIVVDGKLTAWCAQHDPVTYEPQHARSYEHPSISGMESVGIVRFLMSRPDPTPEIQQAILGALNWYDEVKVEGIRYASGDPNGVYFYEDPNSVTWYRFYQIGTNLPIFSGRDGVIKHDILEIEQERRDGYSWAGSYARQLLETAKTTGYFVGRVYVEAVESEAADRYGRNLQAGSFLRVEDGTKALLAIPSILTVAKDGSGDYSTVQQAIDAVPQNNTQPVEIRIMNGVYKEVVTVPANKPFISLIGESAENTVITYDNYAGRERPIGGTYGTSGSASLFLYGSDFTAMNLTMENSFDEKANPDVQGTQAVAVHTRGERMIFRNVRFIGNQDTLLVNAGSSYFYECYVEGDVDFIFGAGRAVFENSDIKSLDRGSATNNGYITAASTSINQPYGFLFINSRLISDAAAGTVYLGRPWHPGGDPSAIASVVFMNCELGQHIHTQGWTDMSGFSYKDARFYEYNNSGPGVAINESRTQLSDEEAAQYTVENVLGWSPVLP